MKIIVVAKETISSMIAPSGSTATPWRSHWPW